MASTKLWYDDVEWVDSPFNLLSAMVAEGDEVNMEIIHGRVQLTSTSPIALIKGSGHNNPPE